MEKEKFLEEHEIIDPVKALENISKNSQGVSEFALEVIEKMKKKEDMSPEEMDGVKMIINKVDKDLEYLKVELGNINIDSN
jgi:hypothetical protein